MPIWSHCSMPIWSHCSMPIWSNWAFYKLAQSNVDAFTYLLVVLKRLPLHINLTDTIQIVPDAISSSHIRGLRSGSTDPSSQHSHESGFQSATSLNSLEIQNQNHQKILKQNSLCSSSSSSSGTFEGSIISGFNHFRQMHNMYLSVWPDG